MSRATMGGDGRETRTTGRTTRATLRGKGQLTLPTGVRAALHIADGDDIEFELVDGGVIMHGLKMIPATQAWFWTDTWQTGEREAADDIAAGRVENFESAGDMFKALG